MGHHMQLPSTQSEPSDTGDHLKLSQQATDYKEVQVNIYNPSVNSITKL